jgi:hypothetical protein
MGRIYRFVTVITRFVPDDLNLDWPSGDHWTRSQNGGRVAAVSHCRRPAKPKKRLRFQQVGNEAHAKYAKENAGRARLFRRFVAQQG